MSDNNSKTVDRELRTAEILAEVKTAFTYHPPTGDQPRRYEAIRAARDELLRAIELIEMAVMQANAAIARSEGGES